MSLREAPGPLFGEFGGRYMPESLIAAIDELAAEYEAAKADPALQARRYEEGGAAAISVLTEGRRF